MDATGLTQSSRHPVGHLAIGTHPRLLFGNTGARGLAAQAARD